MLGVGIIGAGVILEEHASACRLLDNRLRLVGVAELDDSKREAATQKFFIPLASRDYRQLLERSDVDIIHVCTPPSSHEELVISALEAGKYVVCEKPLAHTLKSADRIIEVAKRYPNKLSVMYQLRWRSDLQKTIWLRDNGWLGELQFGHWKRYGPLDHSVSKHGSWWGKWEVAGGGAVMTQFIHHLDEMCCIFGRPVEVTAVLATLAPQLESEDVFSASVRFECDAVVNCCASASAPSYGFSRDVLGTDASVHFPWELNCADEGKRRQIERELLKQFGAPPKPPSRSLPARAARKVGRVLGLGAAALPGDAGVLHAAHMRHLLDAIATDQRIPLPPEEARESLELCVAIYTSAITRKTVRLPLDSGSPFYDGVRLSDYQAMRQPKTAAG
jgi:UDP-N-acetyl-2-amino-2-deoxyglucuronate dehydrogenase